ncbi:GMC family oxidoreductase [Bradyrhizobium sp. CCBAU 51753]|uniref:GMC family oxidoreductase n=1 Tax=Bradyrhizobium sp. CCBAU 51753 TaxID=1325100 RepID=UPI00188D56D0|nr:GMC oxidoreductase [Bradyrhizobium sp. CCBAU 51753]QOZ30089.1 glucose-methanol-choline oxidoreductase [Bradyrhizobium sp. CCBAU 51753]
MSQERYDIVIVGAGAAGCVVASYLAEHTDASIALIEAGDMDRDPFIHIPAGFANILVHDRHVWKYETIPQHGKKRAYRSGKVLGGGSSINAMCYVRGQIRDFAAWQDAVGDTGKWSYEDLLPVFMAQERNAEQLRRHGIAVIVDSPGVGENLHDHPMVPVRAYVKGDLGYQAAAQGLGTIKAGLRYLVTKDGPASGNGIETVTHWNPSDFAADPTIQCYHAPIILNEQLGPTGDRSGVTFELVVLQPKSRGWVRLADSDPTSMPLINPNFIGEEEDLRAAVESVRAIREVMAQESLASVIEEEMDPGPHIQSDAEIGEWVKRVVTTMWHPVGTCRMGRDERAVVDARLRVRGVDGLRVIDASIMPNITSGNTNAPTQALARHATAMLVEDLKRS